MGGFGSGRPRSSRRPVVENAIQLSVSRLRAAGILPDVPPKFGDTIWLDATRDGYKSPLPIGLVVKAQPFGGVQWMLRCGGCRGLCRHLYLLPSGTRFQCRTCAGLSYRSQRLSQHHRYEQQSAKLIRRAGCEPHDDYYHKPRRMRWATFNDLIDRAEYYNTAAVELQMRGVARFLTNHGIDGPPPLTDSEVRLLAHAGRSGDA